MFKHLSRPWIIIGLVILIGGTAYWYHAKAKQQPTVKYQTAQVSKGTLTVSVTGSGNVVVDKVATVNPGISGKVTDLNVKVGDTVKAGQTLFKISNDQLDVTVNKDYAGYLQAKQNLESSKSQLLDAQNAQNDVYNKASATDADKATAAQKVVAAQAAVNTANQNVTAAYAAYQLDKTNANQRTVTASIDGTITALNITSGDQLGSNGAANQSSGSASSGSAGSGSAGSSAPIVIDDLSSLKASVNINEVDAPHVQSGQKVSMTFDAIDGLTLTGKVQQINTVGTESQGVVSYPALITFDSLDNRVKPQMSLTATITTDVRQNVLLAPNAAVKSQSDGTHYIQIMDNGATTPRQQTIEIGEANDTDTEITRGLSEGDTVVTATINPATSSAATNTQRTNLNLFGGAGGGGGFRAGGAAGSGGGAGRFGG